MLCFQNKPMYGCQIAIYDVRGLEKHAKLIEEIYGVGCFEVFIGEIFWVYKQENVGISIICEKDEKRYL